MAAPLEDPEQEVIKMVTGHVSFAGTDILEVGCRNGRLTFHYAGSARSGRSRSGDRQDIFEAIDLVSKGGVAPYISDHLSSPASTIPSGGFMKVRFSAGQ